MPTLFRRHSGHVIALIVGMVLSGAPSAVAAAYDALNSDKVDGKHAVGVRATVAQRAGKLVATDSTGRLPNNIISKAPDAQKLDGRDSAAYLSNHERIMVESPFDGEQFKSVSVPCPEGKKVTGGGYHMSFGVGDVRWDNANVWNNHPATEAAWLVSAYTPMAGNWQLSGYAICARTG